MAKQTINIGASPNDGTGTPLRTSFDYCNLNFTELYTAVGPSGNNIVCPGTLTVSAGTLALPSLTTAGDTNTGIYFPAADTIAFVEGGAEAMRINSTGNLVVNNAATITGDLTVDTSTLKVDSTNNRVGILTASPAQSLDIASGNLQVRTGGTVFSDTFSNYGAALAINAAGSLPIRLQIAGTTAYEITSGNIHTWSNVGGVAGTAMTLNSTGLGVGVVPSSFGRFSVQGTAGGAGILGMNTDATQCDIQSYNKPLAINRAGNNITMCEGGGNVGVGVTPSAWGSNWKVLDLQGGGRVYSLTGTGTHGFSFNAFNNNTNWLYQFSVAASRFELQQSGNFAWFTAPSGTAGNTITFTQALTLDTSGNLLVGTTNTSATAGPGFKAQYSSTVPQFAIVTNEAGSSTALSLYNVNAAAYRFYVNNAGTVFATNTTISAISDARFKENVQDIDVGLGAILALKPRKFDWKAGRGKDIKGDRGFIAQEFEQVFPQLVDEWKDNAPEGEAPYKSVRQDLIPVLVKAIQELTARVQTLEAR